MNSSANQEIREIEKTSENVNKHLSKARISLRKTISDDKKTYGCPSNYARELKILRNKYTTILSNIIDSDKFDEDITNGAKFLLDRYQWSATALNDLIEVLNEVANKK